MPPILSILIATKDREEYVLNILQFILSWKDSSFEVIIQDNSANDKLEQRITSMLDDRRLKYFHYADWLSVSDNFDKGLSYAEGDIICMLGDDDGILEDSIAVAKWMIKKNIDAVLPKHGTYNWPDLISKYNSSLYNSKAIFERSYTGKLAPVDVAKELNYVMKKGCTTMGNLPRLYYGLIKRELLESVKQECKTYFPGPSPDMANAISTSLVTQNFFILDFPLFVAGSCSVSGAGMGTRRLHEGDISSYKHLPKDCEEKWESIIPKFWSGPTIWAESAIKAFRAMSREDKIQDINVEYLYASMLVFNYRRFQVIFNKIIESKKLKKLSIISFYYLIVWFKRGVIILPKLLSRLTKKSGNKLVLSNKMSISEALGEYSNSDSYLSIKRVFDEKE
ncbi:MAG: glycosyltransferase family 2 protein [Glaciecola sp.]|jgi:glycosyltransferase involved in cell wall biosynthesis